MTIFGVISGIFGFIGVAIDAIGAHWLKAHAKDAPQMLESFKTATLYHMIHSLLLLAALFGHRMTPHWVWAVAGTTIVLGITFFCGGIYAKTFLGWSWATKVTPFGGTLFMISWLLLAIGFFLSKH